MSPRLTSTSSVRVTVTACGANASANSPSYVTIDFTRLSLPDGSTMTSSPFRTIPDATVPEKPRKSRLGRRTYCTGKRRSVRLRSLAMCTVSRWSSSGGPEYHGIASLRETTLSPLRRRHRDEGDVGQIQLGDKAGVVILDPLEGVGA